MQLRGSDSSSNLLSDIPRARVMDTRLQLLCRLSRDECIGFFSQILIEAVQPGVELATYITYTIEYRVYIL